MGLETVIAAGALIVGGISAYEGQQARKDASAYYAQASDEQHKANNEQRALNFAQQADERRNQIRQERIARAKILQASENSGAAFSSGESGALGGMNTQLQANLGANAFRSKEGDLIGGYQQNAADFNTAAQRSVMSAQSADSLFSLSTNIFMANGGFKPLKG